MLHDQKKYSKQTIFDKLKSNNTMCKSLCQVLSFDDNDLVTLLSAFAICPAYIVAAAAMVSDEVGDEEGAVDTNQVQEELEEGAVDTNQVQEELEVGAGDTAQVQEELEVGAVDTNQVQEELARLPSMEAISLISCVEDAMKTEEDFVKPLEDGHALLQQSATDTSEARKRLKVAEKEYSAAEVKSANMEAMLSGLKKRHEAVKAQVATLQEQAAVAAAAAPARDGAVAAATVDANAPGQPSSPAIQHAQAEPAIVLFVSKYEDDKAEVERISGILERAHVR